MKPWLKWLIFTLSVLILIEVMLRLVFGFGNLPVYYASAKYEYAIAPNQSMKRFGNDFHTNEAGMRSASLSGNGEAAPQQEWRILKLGDSVLNGGTATDQSELASMLMEDSLRRLFPDKGIRVLNSSAGSWGPDNALAWVQEHGHFGAKAIVLVFSSHDWLDCMEFRQVVGQVPFYPNRKPSLALSDAWSWLWSRYVAQVQWAALPQMPGTPAPTPCRNGPNPGWPGWIQFCREQHLPLLVYHHPTQREWERARFNAQGEALQAWLRVHEVPSISGLEAPYSHNAWRDPIHPNALGQQAIARALQPAMIELIRNEP